MRKIKVAIGTESALKIRALQAALVSMGYESEILYDKTDSGINQQPVGLEEMEEGAKNRAVSASKKHPEAEFYIGIENGLVQQNGCWYGPTCIVVLRPGSDERSVAFGVYFPIPAWMAERAVAHKTESDVGVIVQELARGGEKDAMKYLSEDTVHREGLLAQAIQCAFVPILFPRRYRE